MHAHIHCRFLIVGINARSINEVTHTAKAIRAAQWRLLHACVERHVNVCAFSSVARTVYHIYNGE